MHADYWDVITECMGKQWIVRLASNPAHPHESCCVTLTNWRTGGFWTAFCPTWDEAFERTVQRVRED